MSALPSSQPPCPHPEITPNALLSLTSHIKVNSKPCFCFHAAKGCPLGPFHFTAGPHSGGPALPLPPRQDYSQLRSKNDPAKHHVRANPLKAPPCWPHPTRPRSFPSPWLPHSSTPIACTLTACSPQGLCSCLLCLECSSPRYLLGLYLSFLQIHSNVTRSPQLFSSPTEQCHSTTETT